MSEGFLSQEEIDALLKSDSVPQQDSESQETPGDSHDLSAVQEPQEDGLTREEMDVIGEVGNISMGSAATTLSDIVQHRVSITTPEVTMSTQMNLFGSFKIPYVVINIRYTKGLSGWNLLLISTHDAKIIADLMMGGTGTDLPEEIGEIQLSAVSEAMNQMIGSAATSMSNMFGFPVNISPPSASVVHFDGDEESQAFLNEEKIVAVSFRLVVGDLIDSRIMQIIPLDVAKELVKHLLGNDAAEPEAAEPEAETPGSDVSAEANALIEELLPIMDSIDLESKVEKNKTPVKQETPPASVTAKPVQQTSIQQNGSGNRNLDLILDVPLKVSVILGRCKKPIGEVLKLVPGTIVELDSLSNEPVDILVNGTLIAQGEVVVVNENFGVQVKNIISPEERLLRLKE